MERIAPRRPARNTLRIRRGIAVVLASVLFGSLSTVVASAPAQAATSTAIRACFTTSVVLYSTPIVGPYNRDVIVENYFNGAWYTAATTTPGLDGCLAQSVTPGYYWRFRVYTNTAGRWYVGTSQYAWTVPGYTYNLGTVRV